MTMPIESASRNSRCISVGQTLVCVCFAFLVAGRFAREFFFRIYESRGLTPEILYVLIPIWSIGVLGLLLLVCGWIYNPTIAPQLKLPYPQRPDGTYFGPLVKSLAAILAILLASASVALAFDGIEEARVVTHVIASYCMFCISAFVFYLASFYSARTRIVTTTYLNVFMVVFAILLIPLTWTVLIFLKSRRNGRTKTLAAIRLSPYKPILCQDLERIASQISKDISCSTR